MIEAFLKKKQFNIYLQKAQYCSKRHCFTYCFGVLGVMPVVAASGVDFHSRSPKKVDHMDADLRKLNEGKTINNSQKSKMKLTKLKSIAVEPIFFLRALPPP